MSAKVILLLIILAAFAIETGESRRLRCDVKSDKGELETRPSLMAGDFIESFEKLLDQKNARTEVNSYFSNDFKYKSCNGKVFKRDQFVDWYAQSSRDLRCHGYWIRGSADMLLECDAERKEREGSPFTYATLILDVLIIYEEPFFSFKSMNQTNCKLNQ